MNRPAKSGGGEYQDLYQGFDSPLLQQVRREAYGTDIGQHSWVTAEELEEVICLLKLERASRLLDLGCGPGGPLTFVVKKVGCHGTGLEVSANAVAAGRSRAASLDLSEQATLREADLNQPLPFGNDCFDAVISLDVILHLRDRAQVFEEVARVLIPRGKLLFTDAGVITAAISNEEIRLRTVHGPTQFVPAGGNEKLLESAGFRLIECRDKTSNLLKNAEGRLAARVTHREELETLEGAAVFERQQAYLETVISLSQKGALSRWMYLAESRE